MAPHCGRSVRRTRGSGEDPLGFVFQFALALHDPGHVGVHRVDFFHRPTVKGPSDRDVDEVKNFHSRMMLICCFGVVGTAPDDCRLFPPKTVGHHPCRRWPPAAYLWSHYPFSAPVSVIVSHRANAMATATSSCMAAGSVRGKRDGRSRPHWPHRPAPTTSHCAGAPWTAIFASTRQLPNVLVRESGF